jgi:hypothetical protein
MLWCVSRVVSLSVTFFSPTSALNFSLNFAVKLWIISRRHHSLRSLIQSIVTTQAPHLDLQILKTLVVEFSLFICSIEKLSILNKMPILESS